MNYIFWTIIFIVGSLAIYWMIDYMSHYNDDDLGSVQNEEDTLDAYK